MARRILFITFFVLFFGGVVWYASGFIRIPEKTLDEAAKVDDKKVKLMVAAKVLTDPTITTTADAVDFYVIDTKGTRSKVHFETTDPLVPGQLGRAAESKSTVSLIGHSDPEFFHASSVNFPAY